MKVSETSSECSSRTRSAAQYFRLLFINLIVFFLTSCLFGMPGWPSYKEMFMTGHICWLVLFFSCPTIPCGHICMAQERSDNPIRVAVWRSHPGACHLKSVNCEEFGLVSAKGRLGFKLRLSGSARGLLSGH